jgi:hypothetical protein
MVAIAAQKEEIKTFPANQPTKTISLTLGSSNVLVNESAGGVPFAMMPKTQQQRLKIIGSVLGPPTSVSKANLISMREKVEKSGEKISFHSIIFCFTSF